MSIFTWSMNALFPGVGSEELYMKILRAICGDTKGKSMIDLMCCKAPHTPLLGFEKRMYVDILPRKLDHQNEQQFYVQDDVFNVLRNCDKFDVAICSDGIEHLVEEDGYKLLELMMEKSDKQIIFTPMDDLFGLNNDDTPEAHRSVWKPYMLPAAWATISFPEYHKGWNGGAFFAFHSRNTPEDFLRVINVMK